MTAEKGSSCVACAAELPVGAKFCPEGALAERLLESGGEASSGIVSAAVAWTARAQQDLGWWLVDHGRIEEAAPLLDSARSTCERIDATGWLSRLIERTDRMVTS